VINMLLTDIMKKRCERLICAIFNKQKVTVKDVVNSAHVALAPLIILLIFGFFVGIIISGFLDMFNLTPASVSAARNSMNLLGICIFTTLYGSIILASSLLIYNLTHVHARKIANTVNSTIKNISNIKLAEDTKRKP
jgi:hypothetical protein